MDPFTIALATFGVQKLRGKSTNRALRDAVLLGGGTQLAGMGGIGPFQSFGSTGNALAGSTLGQQFGQTGAMRGIGALFGRTPETQKMFTGIGDDPGLRQGLVGNEAKAGNFFSNLIPKTKEGKLEQDLLQLLY